MHPILFHATFLLRRALDCDKLLLSNAQNAVSGLVGQLRTVLMDKQLNQIVQNKSELRLLSTILPVFSSLPDYTRSNAEVIRFVYVSLV